MKLLGELAVSALALAGMVVAFAMAVAILEELIELWRRRNRR